MGNEWLLIKYAVWLVGFGFVIRIVWELFALGYVGKGKPVRTSYNQSGKATEPNLQTYHHSKMNIKQWLRLVNDEPNLYPHLWIVAKTGSGKTEMCKAILSKRQGKVLILDPKATPNKWGSDVQAIGISDDLTYTSIDKALDLVLNELQTRQRALSSGQTSFEPLTVVVDELTTLAMFSKKVPDVFTKVSVIGRELGVRLIAISQSDRVASLGLQGLGDIREQYLYLALGNKARELLPAINGKYVAVAKLDNAVTELEVSQVMKYSSVGISPSQVSQLAYDALEAIDTDEQDDQVRSEPKQFLSTEETIAITSMLLAGKSGNDIAKSSVLTGSRNDRLAKIKRVREQLSNSVTTNEQTEDIEVE